MNRDVVVHGVVRTHVLLELLVGDRVVVDRMMVVNREVVVKREDGLRRRYYGQDRQCLKRKFRLCTEWEEFGMKSGFDFPDPN